MRYYFRLPLPHWKDDDRECVVDWISWLFVMFMGDISGFTCCYATLDVYVFI